MEKKELDEWYRLLKQVKNGYHLSKEDKLELVRLNHMVMEESHKIHNDNMLNILNKYKEIIIYHCPKCGKDLTKKDKKMKISKGYFKACTKCDEDFYKIELEIEHKIIRIRNKT